MEGGRSEKQLLEGCWLGLLSKVARLPPTARPRAAAGACLQRALLVGWKVPSKEGPVWCSLSVKRRQPAPMLSAGGRGMAAHVGCVER